MSRAHAACWLVSGAGSAGELLGWDTLAAAERTRLLASGPSSPAVAAPSSASSSDVRAASPAPASTSATTRAASVTSAGPSLPRASSQPVSVIRSTSTSQLSSSPPPSSADTSQAQKSEDTQSSLQSSQSSLIMSSSSHASSQLSWLSSPPIVISDEEDEHEDEDEDASLPSQDPKRPRLARDSQGAPVMPDLLAGVRIPEAEGGARTGDECPVCLDPPLHPVTLPCGHIFCFLCAKASLNTSHDADLDVIIVCVQGLTRQGGDGGQCSLCRRDIPDSYLDSSQVMTGAMADLEQGQEDGDQADMSAMFYNLQWVFKPGKVLHNIVKHC